MLKFLSNIEALMLLYDNGIFPVNISRFDCIWLYYYTLFSSFIVSFKTIFDIRDTENNFLMYTWIKMKLKKKLNVKHMRTFDYFILLLS